MKKVHSVLLFVLSLLALYQQAAAQWQQTSLPDTLQISALGQRGTILFAGTVRNGVFRSTDEGATWTPANDGLPPPPADWYGQVYPALAFASLGPSICAAILNRGIYRSTDDGLSWERVYTTYSGNWINCLFATDSMFLGGEVKVSGGLLESGDTGRTWQQSSQPFTPTGFATSGSYVFAGAEHYMYRSGDGGRHWSALPNSLGGNHCVTALGQNIFMAAWDILWRSSDNGESWTSVPIPLIEHIVSMSAQPKSDGAGDLFVCGVKKGGTTAYVIGSSDGGSSWVEVDRDFTISARYWDGGDPFPLLTDEDFLSAGTRMGVWRLPLSTWTSVESSSKSIPLEFALEQNYPNPFNPSTMIRYTVGGSQGSGLGTRNVQMRVYDVLGREVAVLVNEPKAPGSYEATFHGSGLASGIYFYRLEAGAALFVRKMALVR